MSSEFSRYSCQIALPGFGEQKQQLLQNAKVLIVGAGGLGCPAAQYLAASGVGTLGIVDDDKISESNLHRQILYNAEDVGEGKAVKASERLQKQNPGIKIVPHQIRVTEENVLELFAGYDIVIDCTDNFDTRYLLSDAAVLTGKPLIYGAIYQYEGQVAVWNIQNTDGSRTPNYRDLFPQVNASQVPNCTEGGVIPTLAGIIGCIQANEAIKYVTSTDDLLAGKMLIFDAQTMQSRVIKIGARTKANITHLPHSVVIPLISATEMRSDMEGGGFQLIDVRSIQEHDAFNIGGINIPVDELEENLDQLDKGNKIIFYCSTGLRSAEAVKIIQNKISGLDVFSLEGGLKAWSEL
jgi:adenylyltransferase/sulfurtransferase